MAKQGNWNKSYWKKLNKLAEPDITKLYSELHAQTEYTREMLEVLTPIKFGGLVASRYSICEMYGDKIYVRAGYTQTPHWDLDPADPHQDDITNTQLLQYLIETVDNPATAQALFSIQDWLNELQYQCRQITAEYFSNYVKDIMNGGK